VNGEMDGASSTATVVEGMRVQLTRRHTGRMPTCCDDGPYNRPSERRYAATSGALAFCRRRAGTARLASLGIDFLDGITLPETATLSRCTCSLRAIRRVSERSGKSATGMPAASRCRKVNQAKPGSGHYTDQATAWIDGRLWPLPFSDAAVSRTVVHRETLLP